jgi:hypothetical protein
MATAATFVPGARLRVSLMVFVFKRPVKSPVPPLCRTEPDETNYRPRKTARARPKQRRRDSFTGPTLASTSVGLVATTAAAESGPQRRTLQRSSRLVRNLCQEALLWPFVLPGLDAKIETTGPSHEMVFSGPIEGGMGTSFCVSTMTMLWQQKCLPKGSTNSSKSRLRETH